jgi:putative transposase
MVLDPACGVPAIHYSDNGAYRGDRHRSVMARIGTTLMFSEAYRAQARGVIERFNSSVWVPLARQQATYCGDDADPEYLKKQLAIANGDGSNLSAWSDFVADCRRALADYNARPHATLQGKSPDEAWALAVDAGWQPTPLTGDDLHDLLPSEQRQVRRGEITLPWGRYASEQLRTWHGLTVRVSFDPMDGAQVWVADDRGRLICTAERDANARPYVPQTMLAHAQAQRTQGRVARLERALDAVREEGATQIEYVPAPIDPQVRADVLAALAVAPPSQDFNPPADETDLRKVHARWLLVERRIKAGEPVSAQEAQGWEIYRHSDLFRSADEFFRLFGLEAEDVLGAPAAAETEDTE